MTYIFYFTRSYEYIGIYYCNLQILFKHRYNIFCTRETKKFERKFNIALQFTITVHKLLYIYIYVII